MPTSGSLIDDKAQAEKLRTTKLTSTVDDTAFGRVRAVSFFTGALGRMRLLVSLLIARKPVQIIAANGTAV